MCIWSRCHSDSMSFPFHCFFFCTRQSEQLNCFQKTVTNCKCQGRPCVFFILFATKQTCLLHSTTWNIFSDMTWLSDLCEVEPITSHCRWVTRLLQCVLATGIVHKERESFMREERRDETIIYLRGHFWIFPAFTLPQTLRTPTFQPLTPESFTLIKAAKHTQHTNTVVYKKNVQFTHRHIQVFINRVKWRVGLTQEPGCSWRWVWPPGTAGCRPSPGLG